MRAQGEGLTLFYNPAATKLTPNDVFGVAFNGGFNQPIMCGGEPRQMTLQVRGSADPPIYSIRIRVPQHGACVAGVGLSFIQVSTHLHLLILRCDARRHEQTLTEPCDLLQP
jgi:hypothetical protein